MNQQDNTTYLEGSDFTPNRHKQEQFIDWLCNKNVPFPFRSLGSPKNTAQMEKEKHKICGGHSCED